MMKAILIFGTIITIIPIIFLILLAGGWIVFQLNKIYKLIQLVKFSSHTIISGVSNQGVKTSSAYSRIKIIKIKSRKFCYKIDSFINFFFQFWIENQSSKNQKYYFFLIQLIYQTFQYYTLLIHQYLADQQKTYLQFFSNSLSNAKNSMI